MKLCVDCKHCVKPPYQWFKCFHPANTSKVNPVTGSTSFTMSPESMRDFGPCGPDAKLFVQKKRGWFS